MSNIDTVKEMYEAFGGGDIAAILDKLDENVEWDTQYESAAAPWLKPRRGRESVAGFFCASRYFSGPQAVRPPPGMIVE